MVIEQGLDLAAAVELRLPPRNLLPIEAFLLESVDVVAKGGRREHLRLRGLPGRAVGWPAAAAVENAAQ